MRLSAPWADYVDIISLHPVKLSRDEPMGLNAPWVDSFEIISLGLVRKIAEY